MSDSSSFGDLMSRVQAGDSDAEAELFNKYAGRLIGLAHLRLGNQLRQKVGAEDVVQSVFKSFFLRNSAGQFELDGWGGLWGLLTTITLRKCGRKIDAFRTERRDVRRERQPNVSEQESWARWEAVAREPTPAEAVILSETVERLLQSLSSQDQQIVTMALQGYSATEISEAIGRSERTVRRKIQETRQRLERSRDEDLVSQ